MDQDFWHTRWKNNEIGFHCSDVNPHLRRFWGELGLTAGQRVLVPLCGKSEDLLWLRAQGYGVVGAELSPLAVEQFFLSSELAVNVRQQGVLQHWISDGIEIFCGDFFALEPHLLGEIHGLYDRAALVALPPAMRRDYVGKLTRMAPCAEGLLITLEYPQERANGPPFSVEGDEVTTLYRPHFAVTERHHQLSDDVPPKFRDAGIDSLTERVYRLRSD
ncbi:thiopurine S-methyltransferase [Motiliproteus sediminis]|uniref:thiopurine S-methyltransferase n=1 Tax=Motiliproteus sediminis TaxID=1468178 RepID=UPI001AEF92C0|nr:thiopurine S-methyltransferase [Motiliproteus sediminis]